MRKRRRASELRFLHFHQKDWAELVSVNCRIIIGLLLQRKQSLLILRLPIRRCRGTKALGRDGVRGLGPARRRKKLRIHVSGIGSAPKPIPDFGVNEGSRHREFYYSGR